MSSPENYCRNVLGCPDLCCYGGYIVNFPINELEKCFPGIEKISTKDDVTDFYPGFYYFEVILPNGLVSATVYRNKVWCPDNNSEKGGCRIHNNKPSYCTANFPVGGMACNRFRKAGGLPKISFPDVKPHRVSLIQNSFLKRIGKR